MSDVWAWACVVLEVRVRLSSVDAAPYGSGYMRYSIDHYQQCPLFRGYGGYKHYDADLGEKAARR